MFCCVIFSLSGTFILFFIWFYLKTKYSFHYCVVFQHQHPGSFYFHNIFSPTLFLFVFHSKSPKGFSIYTHINFLVISMGEQAVWCVSRTNPLNLRVVFLKLNLSINLFAGSNSATGLRQLMPLQFTLVENKSTWQTAALAFPFPQGSLLFTHEGRVLLPLSWSIENRR